MIIIRIYLEVNGDNIGMNQLRVMLTLLLIFLVIVLHLNVNKKIIAARDVGGKKSWNNGAIEVFK